MRIPGVKLLLCIIALALLVSVFVVAGSGIFGASEGTAATSVKGVAFLLGLGALYGCIVCGLAAAGAARITAGKGVIAAWDVGRSDWEAFRRISLADTGVSVPFLASLAFKPRANPAFPVRVVFAQRGMMIDGAYFALAPGVRAGMEKAGMTNTVPACVAFVLLAPYGGSGSVRLVRSLLLAPIPAMAAREADRVLNHYLEEIAGVRGLGDVMAQRPGLGRALFWGGLALSMSAAIAGIYLETIDYPGIWPDVMAITGIMLVLAILLLGWLWRPRSQ